MIIRSAIDLANVLTFLTSTRMVRVLMSLNLKRNVMKINKITPLLNSQLIDKALINAKNKSEFEVNFTKLVEAEGYTRKYWDSYCEKHFETLEYDEASDSYINEGL